MSFSSESTPSSRAELAHRAFLQIFTEPAKDIMMRMDPSKFTEENWRIFKLYQEHFEEARSKKQHANQAKEKSDRSNPFNPSSSKKKAKDPDETEKAGPATGNWARMINVTQLTLDSDLQRAIDDRKFSLEKSFPSFAETITKDDCKIPPAHRHVLAVYKAWYIAHTASTNAKKDPRARVRYLIALVHLDRVVVGAFSDDAEAHFKSDTQIIKDCRSFLKKPIKQALDSYARKDGVLTLIKRAAKLGGMCELWGHGMIFLVCDVLRNSFIDHETTHRGVAYERVQTHMKTVGLAEEAKKQGFNKIVNDLLDALAEKGGESGGGTQTGAEGSGLKTGGKIKGREAATSEPSADRTVKRKRVSTRTCPDEDVKMTEGEKGESSSESEWLIEILE